MNGMIDIYDAIKAQLKPLGITIYKEVKPESETGNCMVLSNVPIKKNNVNSINDLIIFVYLLKKEGYFDDKTASTLFSQIESTVDDVLGDSLSCPTEKVDPQTINYNDTYTVSELIFRIMNF